MHCNQLSVIGKLLAEADNTYQSYYSFPCRRLPSGDPKMLRRIAFLTMTLLVTLGVLSLHGNPISSAAEIDDIKAKIKKHEAEADEAVKEFEAIQSWEDTARKEILEAKAKVDLLEEKEDKLTELVRRRAIEMYKGSGDPLSLSFLTSDAADITEYDRRTTYLETVIKSDTDTLGEYTRVKEELRVIKKVNLARQKELAQARKDLERESQRIKENLAVAKKEYAKIQGNEYNYYGRIPIEGRYCPVNGPVSFIDSWGFARSGGRRHKGVDMMSPHGTPLVAITSGVIDRIGNGGLGGITFWLRGDDGHSYYYAHNSRNTVVKGQRVIAGQLLAYVGNTGNARSTAPHVHFEIHPNGGRAVNPYQWVRPLCRQ